MDEKPYARRRRAGTSRRARGYALARSHNTPCQTAGARRVRRQRSTVSGGRSRPAGHPDTHARRPGRAPQGTRACPARSHAHHAKRQERITSGGRSRAARYPNTPRRAARHVSQGTRTGPWHTETMRLYASTSRTAKAMPSAFRPYLSSRSSAGPDSP